MEIIMIKFTFNKKARLVAMSAIRKLEGGSFASAILGSFSANPKVTAISALVLFVLCRAGLTIIAGIEDRSSRTEPKEGSASRRVANSKTDDTS
jgi:hypothetical protein